VAPLVFSRGSGSGRIGPDTGFANMLLAAGGANDLGVVFLHLVQEL